MSNSHRAWICALACALALSAPVGAGAWCDIVFRDVARQAETVLLARVEKEKDRPPSLRVVDVLKGEYRQELLSLDPDALDGSRVGHEDHVMVALGANRRPLGAAAGLGMCDAISVLPIRGGKLRARDRVDYDSRNETITLEQLREQLLRDLSEPSRQVVRISDR